MSLNKNLSQLVVLCLGVAVLSGCDLTGTLAAKNQINLVDTKGRPVAIAPGSYKTKLGKDGDHKVKFNVNVGGKEREIRFNLAPGQSMPKYVGDITIPAATSGQSVDFHGIVDTQESDGIEMGGSQTCTTTAQVRVCKQVPTTRNGQPATIEQCDFEPQTVTGNQEIRHHSHVSTTTATISLLTPGTQDEVGHFEADHSDSNDVITWTGRCITAYDSPGRGGDWNRGPGRR